MRVMVLLKATEESEAGKLPGEELLAAMGRFNEELHEAGILLAGEGLQPSSKGKRVRFGGGEKHVVDGPFPATGELVSGFWLWRVESMDQALEWVDRLGGAGEHHLEVEIRPVFEAEDFGEELTPELREREERLRRDLDAARRT